MNKLEETLADAVDERSCPDEYAFCLEVARAYINGLTSFELSEHNRVLDIDGCHFEYLPEIEAFSIVGDDDEC